MALLDSFDQLRILLDATSSGEGLLQSWLRSAESFDRFVPHSVQRGIVEEAQRAVSYMKACVPPAVSPEIRAIWLGLFERGPDSAADDQEYILTTYASLSEETSQDNVEWWCGPLPRQETYFGLPALTAAHPEPKGVSKDTSYTVYGLLPLAVLAMIVKELSGISALSGVQEFAFGWDSGDLVIWSPEKK